MNAGAQPRTYQGREKFYGVRCFDKYFMYYTQKKTLKNLGFFPSRYSRNCFLTDKFNS